MFQPDAYAESLPRRYLLLRIVVPAVGHCINARNQSDLEVAATRLMLAIELYNARNGRYPAALADLVPSILPSLPTDPISLKGFGYRLLSAPEGGTGLPPVPNSQAQSQPPGAAPGQSPRRPNTDPPPIDPMSILRPDGSPRPYLLYSFGYDGIDNRGKTTKSSQSGRTALRNSIGGPGLDFIFNEPHRLTPPAKDPDEDDQPASGALFVPR